MMKFSEGFFELQLRFAERVTELSSLPLEKALLDYTNLYVRFGLGRAFDPQHPVWLDFLAGFAAAANRADWTWRFFQSREPYPAPSTMVATFGCFSYALAAKGYIRLHFENVDPDGPSPLSRARREARLAELRALFDHVKHTQPGVTHAAGVSWLYTCPPIEGCFPRVISQPRRLPSGDSRTCRYGVSSSNGVAP